jgi:hypothetical protein
MALKKALSSPTLPAEKQALIPERMKQQARKPQALPALHHTWKYHQHPYYSSSLNE